MAISCTDTVSFGATGGSTMERGGLVDYSLVADSEPPTRPQPVGIYGWRKRCLYAFLLFLTVVVIMNFALTVWILRVMDFSIDGMGKLRITPKGLRLEGEAEFLNSVYAEHIQASQGKDLHVESDSHIHLKSGQQAPSSLSVGESHIEAACDSFEIKDSQGRTRFLVTNDEVFVGSSAVEVLFSGVARFNGSVETPTLLGPMSEPFKLESKTSAVHISAYGDVTLDAQTGDINLQTLHNIRLEAKTGSIYLDSKELNLLNVAESDPVSSGQTYSDVFQLCMCPSGRIFVSSPLTDCIATEDICRPS